VHIDARNKIHSEAPSGFHRQGTCEESTEGTDVYYKRRLTYKICQGGVLGVEVGTASLLRMRHLEGLLVRLAASPLRAVLIASDVLGSVEHLALLDAAQAACAPVPEVEICRG